MTIKLDAFSICASPPVLHGVLEEWKEIKGIRN